MSSKSVRSWPAAARPAMTLIEVLAGLALLAALLGGIVSVKVRWARQARVTEQRRLAIRASDELLSAWWLDLGAFPRSSQGLAPGRPGLMWRTEPLANPSVVALGGEVVRLDVRDVLAAEDAPPLARVEVVIPIRVKNEIGVHAH